MTLLIPCLLRPKRVCPLLPQTTFERPEWLQILKYVKSSDTGRFFFPLQRLCKFQVAESES